MSLAAVHAGAEIDDGVTRRLADWAAGFRASDRPATVPLVRAALVDVIGCMIAGSGDAAPRAVAAVTPASGGNCTAIGYGHDHAPAVAAFINATAAHALDFDDSGTTVLGHASAVLAPALLGLAEAEDLSAGAVIDAFVVGIELQDRLGRIANPAHYAAGWHSTSTLCALGAAGACAHLLRLDSDGILAAISNASSMIGGSKKQFGTPMKPIHAGLGARAAVEAALLARAGISGDPEPLAGAWGVFRLFDADPHAGAVERALADLGAGTALEAGVLQLKRFPCCAASHKSLDGIIALLAPGRVEATEVVAIDTWIPAPLAANLRFHQPTDVMQARFSMTYCASRLLDTGWLRLSDFSEAAVSQFAVPERLSRIKMHEIPTASDPMGVPVRTVVTLRSGERVEITVQETKGGGDSPLSDADVTQKFFDCCDFAGLSPDEASARIEAVRALPASRGSRSLMAALAYEQKARP